MEIFRHYFLVIHGRFKSHTLMCYPLRNGIKNILQNFRVILKHSLQNYPKFLKTCFIAIAHMTMYIACLNLQPHDNVIPVAIEWMPSVRSQDYSSFICQYLLSMSSLYVIIKIYFNLLSRSHSISLYDTSANIELIRTFIMLRTIIYGHMTVRITVRMLYGNCSYG